MPTIKGFRLVDDFKQKFVWIQVVCECYRGSISVGWTHSRHRHSVDFCCVNRSWNQKKRREEKKPVSQSSRGLAVVDGCWFESIELLGPLAVGCVDDSVAASARGLVVMMSVKMIGSGSVSPLLRTSCRQSCMHPQSTQCLFLSFFFLFFFSFGGLYRHSGRRVGSK